MQLSFLKWLGPIVLEFFKSNTRFRTYIKRNFSIATLVIALFFSIAFNLYLFEQATVYGATLKDVKGLLTHSDFNLEVCNTQEKALKIACRIND